MSDQASIFNANQSGEDLTNKGSASNASNVQPNAQLETLLLEIKNERGEPKYKTIEEALIGLKNAQEYIPTLKQTLSQKEQELADAKRKADEVEELKRVVQELTAGKQSTPTGESPAITPQQVAELVEQALEKKQTQAQQSANVSTVLTATQQAFGDKAEEVFYSRASELGLSKQEINALAAKSPKVVLQLLGIKEAAKQTPSPTQGTVNTSGFQPSVDTFIGRNNKPTLLGATSQDVIEESRAARKMVDELHAQGKSVHDLTDPKVYNKLFGKKG